MGPRHRLAVHALCLIVSTWVACACHLWPVVPVTSYLTQSYVASQRKLILCHSFFVVGPSFASGLIRCSTEYSACCERGVS